MAARTKRPVGRPTKLTPELQEKILTAIRAGNYVETAAAHCGINKVTLYDWMKRGAAEESGIYREFSNAIEKAWADAEVRDVALLAKAAQENWQAIAWRLERRHPDRWARRERLEHSGEVTMRHGVNAGDLNAILAALGYDPLGTTLPGAPGEAGAGDRAPEEDSGGGA